VEESRQAEERARLVLAWRQLQVTGEAYQKVDVVVRQRREEAHREAKEICDGVFRDAEEILEKARGDLEVVEAREAALEEETNSKHQELQALEGDVAAREQAISAREEKTAEREESVRVREEDAEVHERELENSALEQSAERDRLEVLEWSVAAAQASYDTRVAKANA
jgi:hypothetical protein